MALIPDVIHRAELPIDDRPHGIDLTGDILHAAVRRHGAVDVWYQARRDQGLEHMRRSFQIVATGQPWPPMMARHHATAVSPDGQLVWHVLENICPHLEVRMDARGDYGPGGECQHCRVSLTRRGTERWIPA